MVKRMCAILLLKYRQLSFLPATARSLSKLAVRGPELKNLSGRLQEDAERFTNHTLLPSTQKYLESYLDSLKKKK